MGWDYKSNNCVLSQDFRDKYIVNIKGKEYVTVNGLLALGHEKGLNSLKTKIIQYPNKDNDMVCIVEATCIGYSWNPIDGVLEKGEFTAIGDASTKSISNSAIAVHYIRMAETRAVGRLLRNYTNIGMVSIEEMDSVIDIPKISATQINRIVNIMKNKNIGKDTARDQLLASCGKAELKETSPEEAEAFIKILETL